MRRQAALAQKHLEGIIMLKREAVKQSNQVKVTFVLPHDPNQGHISVVGDFNNWDPAATRMSKRPNNTRSASVTLDPGQRYQFRYYVEDGTWLNDDNADAYEPNEHGTQNCLLIT
jgi:1,4-alpha-glucan branching enzyme